MDTGYEYLAIEVDTFCGWIENLPAGVCDEQLWGPKEVLAHLLNYHELYADQAQAFIEGKTVELPNYRRL
jgi:hypothetical protein